jgi:hypothetical protein
MKINYTKWGTSSPKGSWQFATPYINIIHNKGQYNYTQVSFVVGNHHWWIIINKKKK